MTIVRIARTLTYPRTRRTATEATPDGAPTSPAIA
jgi:hypothetical protein